MKNQANILKWVTILFLVRTIYSTYLQILNLISASSHQKVIHKIFGISFPKELSNTWLWISNFLILFVLFYLIYQLTIFIKIANNLNKNLLFTDKNAYQLRKIGKGIVIITTILIIIETPLAYSILLEENSLDESNSYYRGRAFGSLISKRLYLYIISIFILIISSLIKSGEIIKQENDLTI